MKKGKLGLAAFSVVALLVILLMAIHTLPAAPVDTAPVSVQIGTETVEVWRLDEEHYYAFLPGCAGEVQILPGTAGATLDGKALPQSSGDFAMNTPYELIWQEGGAEQKATLQLVPAGGTATLFLDTQSGSMDHIHAQKGNAERGSLRLYGEDGSLNYSGTLSSLRGRGNSTWVVHDKKPYSLDLTEEADLLGMGSAKKWILLADALDASALRNKIVYDFVAQIGMGFTPETRWTEVYLNGEYAGLYLLCERIENEPQRTELGADGCIIRMDRDTRIEEETDPYFFTDSNLCLQILDGRDSASLRSQFQTMEDALLAPDDQQWQDLIDLDSWVKQYLMEEVFTSYDAGFQSQYFYCYDTAQDSRIYAGPLWDYDSSLGNPHLWALRSPRGLFAWRPEAMEGYATPWYHSLYEKEAFRQELVRQYQDIILPQVEILLSETLDRYVAQIGTAFSRNQIRWSVDTEGVGAEAAYIAEYLRQRIAFLSELWLEEKEFCIVRLRDDGAFYIYYALEPGSSLKDLPHMEDEAYPVWYRTDTGAVFDLSTPIWEDLCLDTVAGREEKEESEDSLMDWLLKVYHYVPAAALLLMGAAMLPFAIRKGRGAKQKEKQGV